MLAIAATFDVIEIPGGARGDHLPAPRADRLAAGDERGEAAPFSVVVGLILARPSCHGLDFAC
jgi:hypothetical protein